MQAVQREFILKRHDLVIQARRNFVDLSSPRRREIGLPPVSIKGRTSPSACLILCTTGTLNSGMPVKRSRNTSADPADAEVPHLPAKNAGSPLQLKSECPAASRQG